MKLVELYGRVRYAVQIEDISRREVARHFGIDRKRYGNITADFALRRSATAGWDFGYAGCRRKCLTRCFW
jgi:hypothetical protein